MMLRVVHFEIHAADPERAARFYRDLLGWEIAKWEGPQDYWTITTGPRDRPGIDGGLLPRRGPDPSEGQAVNSYVCTVEVSGLDGLLERVGQLGGSLAVPKTEIPTVGWLAYAKDPEGNLFGLLEPHDRGE